MDYSYSMLQGSVVLALVRLVRVWEGESGSDGGCDGLDKR